MCLKLCVDSGDPNYVLGFLRTRRNRVYRESLINFRGYFPVFFVVKKTRGGGAGISYGVDDAVSVGFHRTAHGTRVDYRRPL